MPVAIDKAANRAGMREYGATSAEWRKTHEPCGDDLEAIVKAEADDSNPTTPSITWQS